MDLALREEHQIIIWLLPIGVFNRNPQAINCDYELRVHLVLELPNGFGEGASRPRNTDVLMRSLSKLFISEETTLMN
jgi:hypothetical protein